MTTIFPLSSPAAKTKMSSGRKGNLISSMEPEKPFSLIFNDDNCLSFYLLFLYGY